MDSASAIQSADHNDRLKELKAFDDTKAGVKGLVDTGISSLPSIFIRPQTELMEDLSYGHSQVQVPVIDFRGVADADRHRIIVDEVRQASEEWGFFQLVHHGIPESVLDGMIDGTRKFHEQDPARRKEYYTRDNTRKVRYSSNIDLYQSSAASWRDTLTISLISSSEFEPEELPQVCRSEAIDYINSVTELGKTLFEILSEALGLKQDRLNNLGCAMARTFVGNYYPPCPQPELTMGITKHTDPAFLTILLQDQIGGLQILHDSHWIDVPPIPGSLVVNIADLLQIVSNDKFKSVEHRVIASHNGPRISAACFFVGNPDPTYKYGPIKELIPEDSSAVYKEFTVREYIKNFFAKKIDKSLLRNMKI